MNFDVKRPEFKAEIYNILDIAREVLERLTYFEIREVL